MADLKISELTEATAPASSDSLPVVSGGATKRTTLANGVKAGLPAQSGHNGKALKTNGSSLEWGATGDVAGPASASDSAIALFDGTTGKLLKNSGKGLPLPYDQIGIDAGGMLYGNNSDIASILNLPTYLRISGGYLEHKETLHFAVSDETTAITTGTAKVTFRMPFAIALTRVKATLTTASTSGVVTVDINEGGASILSTKLTIDANEKTSQTAAAAAVISASALADDAEMTIDIDTAGTGAAGLKVLIEGWRL